MCTKQLGMLVLQLICSAFMTGVIWFVQVVHYKLFTAVGQAKFLVYHREHMYLTTRVVALPMVVELLIAIYLVFFPQLSDDAPPLPPQLTWTGLALVVIIWTVTVLVQVPMHKILSRGYLDHTIHNLRISNWARTIAWSLRTFVAAWMLFGHFEWLP